MKHTEEHKKRISISLKGHNVSHKTKDKISKSGKGKIAWNKGKKTNKEIRDKISKSRKGQAPWNKGIKGLIKTNSGSFKKGEHFSSETEIKKGQRLSPRTEFKLGQEPWNKGKEHMQDENHPLWKGDDVGNKALHKWIQKKKGKPKKCVKCGSIKNIYWSNISYKYKRGLDDWEELCQSCHMKKDIKNGWGKRREIFDKNGQGKRIIV